MELEESINIYERGEALKEHCDRLLKQAEAKVEKLTFNQAGEPPAPSRSSRRSEALATRLAADCSIRAASLSTMSSRSRRAATLRLATLAGRCAMLRR